MAKLGSSKTLKEEKVVGTVDVKYCRKGGSEDKPVWYAGIQVEGMPVFMNNVLLFDGSDDKDPFVAFPNKSYEKDGKREFTDIAAPASKEARQLIMDVVIEAYQKLDEGELSDTDTYSRDGVEVKYMRANPIPGNERALMRCSLTVECAAFISDIQARQREDGTVWLAYPQRSYEVDGERKYSPIAGPGTGDVNKAITAAVSEKM
jgi:DNA-binding cell septation regulator SpoVG